MVSEIILDDDAETPNIGGPNKIFYVKGKTRMGVSFWENEAVVIARDRTNAVTMLIWNKIDKVEEIGVTFKSTGIVLQKRRKILRQGW